MTEGRFGLHGHEVVVVLDGVGRLGRVDHLPDDDGGDLDRIAVGVVDLQMVRLEVAHPQADGPAHGEGEHAPEARLGDGADVAAEELDDRGLPGWDDDQRRRHQCEHDDGQPDDARVVLGTQVHAVATGGEDDDGEPSVDGDGAALGDVDPGPLVADGLRCDVDCFGDAHGNSFKI